MSNKNDARILEMRKQIQKKKDEIGKIGKFVAVTNCILELDGLKYNINVLDKNQLLKLYIKLNSQFMSARELRVDNEVEYSGYKLTEWIDDLSSKLTSKTKMEEIKKLLSMESKLEKLLSDDKQVELEIDEIESMLG